MGRSNVNSSKRDAVLTLLTVAFVIISTTTNSKSAYAQSSTCYIHQKQKVQFPGSDMCSSNLQTCIDNAPDEAVIEIAARPIRSVFSFLVRSI